MLIPDITTDPEDRIYAKQIIDSTVFKKPLTIQEKFALYKRLLEAIKFNSRFNDSYTYGEIIMTDCMIRTLYHNGALCIKEKTSYKTFFSLLLTEVIAAQGKLQN